MTKIPQYEDVDLVSHKLHRLIDSLTVESSGLIAKPMGGFVQALPKDYGQYPSVGLKIHLTISWNNPLFLNVVGKIFFLCNSKNIDGRRTLFKVMLPENQKQLLEKGNIQGNKSITIFPRYLEHEVTNVAETIRLVARVKRISQEVKTTRQESENSLLGVERQSAPNIFIRPGSFKNDGLRYENASREEPFEVQLEKNLSSPGTDGELFKKLVNEAIVKGEL